MAMSKLSEEVREIIQQGTMQAVEAGRIAGEQAAKDAVRATERRLSAFPTLKVRVADLKEELEELKTHDVRSKSKDITCYVKNSVRLDPEEVRESLIANKEYEIARDSREIEKVEKALKLVEQDEYYMAVYGRYIAGMSDEQIAEKIPCDQTTVWRNRRRLVQNLAVWFYGASAEET